MEATEKDKDEKSDLRVVDLIRRYRWQAGLSEQGYPPEQLEEILHVLQLVTACGTGQLGSHVFSCDGCGRMLTGDCVPRQEPSALYTNRPLGLAVKV